LNCHSISQTNQRYFALKELPLKCIVCLLVAPYLMPVSKWGDGVPRTNDPTSAVGMVVQVCNAVITGVKEANLAEPMLAGSSGVGPDIELGVGYAEAFGDASNLEKSVLHMAQVYGDEENWLVWRGGRGFAMLSEQHTPLDILRLLYQVLHCPITAY